MVGLESKEHFLFALQSAFFLASFGFLKRCLHKGIRDKLSFFVVWTEQNPTEILFHSNKRENF